jgi:hypothetical protein
MLLVFWLLLFVVSTCLMLLMPALVGREIYSRYRGIRAVTCPENRQPVAVSFRAFRAAVTGLNGRPEVRLAECTRWPAHQDCAQDCIPEAVRTSPCRQDEVMPAKSKRIYHLPIAVAAFVAWMIGAVWHSQYLFRPQWAESLGLNAHDLRQIVWWRAPHLLTFAVPLLFAYGVAWLLEVNGKRGPAWGLITSTALWLALAAGGIVGVRSLGISTELLKMEIGYTLLASLAVGAIVGGLSGKLLEQSLSRTEQ